MNPYRWHGGLAEEVAIESPGLRPITILRDVDDDATLTHALLDAHNPPGGVITVHPTPATISGLALAADVLAALGCAIERITPERVAAVGPASRAVLAWVYALRVQHLVVLRAHTLTPDQLAWLLRVRRSSSVHLVLVWHSLDPLRGRVLLDELPHHLVVDPGGVLSDISTHTPASAAVGVDLAQVPATDVRTFRADAAAALEPAEFARVDAVYAQAIETTCAWIAAHTGHPCKRAHAAGGSGRWLGDEDAALAEAMLEALHTRHAHLRKLYAHRPEVGMRSWHETLGLYRLLGGLVADSPGRYTTITRLRGAQAAFELHGLRLALPPNLAYCVGPGLSTTPVDCPLVHRIRAHTANPVHAAAVAVALFTGATIRELKTIPCLAFAIDTLICIDPVDRDDPTRLSVWPIPAAARPLLEAALLFQQTAPDPSAGLFDGAIGVQGQILRDTITTAGLITPARHPWHHGWLWQTGMLWRGPRPQPRRYRPSPRWPNPPTFQRPHETGLVPIEERVPLSRL
ncbi:hypothetical protein AB0M45_16230 [Nocardia sp. NPDC051787]|uniref:hypothetical protein n=1 Tax=Nocardia sp. NPDC051787 TaxID=3155415 RepID=UPI003436BC4E